MLLAPIVGAILCLAATGSASVPLLRATFIGNEAVHLTDGMLAVLVDFPYKSGAFGYMEWSKATVPAGPSPLCVFSHAHEDHFDAGQVREFCGAVLGPKDVVAAADVPALKLEPEVRWKGITLRPLSTPHGKIEHYSFVLEWSGRRLYFSGDTEDPATLLALRDLDAAFVSPWLLETASKRGRIDARRVVVYHHTVGEAVPEVQGRILPKPGQVLSLGSDGHRVEE